MENRKIIKNVIKKLAKKETVDIPGSILKEDMVRHYDPRFVYQLEIEDGNVWLVGGSDRSRFDVKDKKVIRNYISELQKVFELLNK
jgi:hypothetical protein